MRTAKTAATLLLACSVALSALACDRRARTPADLLAQLQSPEWKERRDAAEELRDDGPPSPQALPYLFAALQREQNPKAYGEILITLGASGAAEAKPIIDARIVDGDKDMRKWAEEALHEWLVRNGLMGKRDDLPPRPHPFYGPVAVPPGAPASQPMLVPGYYPPPGQPLSPGQPLPPGYYPAPGAPPAPPPEPPPAPPERAPGDTI